MSNLAFTPDNWPRPVQIVRAVTLYSPYRVKLDLCGGGQPARVLLNVTSSGSLLVQRFFLRNLMPSTPQDLTGFGPVPAFLSSGGRVSFSVVVFHFLPATTWVFTAPPGQSFWARERSSPGVMTEIYTGGLLQLEVPALYVLKYSSPQYSLAVCYSPVDLESCYADNDEQTTLVYCLYTFADALRNPHVRYARVFHDIGVDRVAYNPRNPIVLTTPKTYSACPGARPSMNMDAVYAGVAVRASLELIGLRFRGSLPTNYTTWPRNLPLLLGLLDNDGAGSISLINSTVEVPDLPRTVRILKSLPSKEVADPSRPNLQPSVDAWPTPSALADAQAIMDSPNVVAGGGWIVGAWAFRTFNIHPSTGLVGSIGITPELPAVPGFHISNWVLSQNAWQQFASLNVYDSFSTPNAAVWRFSNVRVEQANITNVRSVCFGAAVEQGATMRSQVAVVATDAQLRAALVRAARYIQVVADIKFDPANWPTGDNALLVEAGIIEVRGCHPTAGKRYTVDLSNLRGVVRSSGRLLLQGNLRFVNLGWTSLSANEVAALANGGMDMSLLGAFEVVPNRAGGLGTVELEGVLLQEMLGAPGAGALRPSDLLAVLHLTDVTPALRLRNVTVGSSGAMLGMWGMDESGTQSGSWVFINTEVQWAPSESSTAAAGTDSGSDNSSSTNVVAIAVPVAVGGAALIAAAVVAFVYLRRRNNGSGSSVKAAAYACKDVADPEVGAGGRKTMDNSSSTSTTGDMATGLAVAKQSTGNGDAPDSMGSGHGTDASTAGGANFTPRASTTPEGPTSSRGPLNDIDAAKRAIAAGRPSLAPCSRTAVDELELQAILGEGSYGRVYRALWRGTTVAVKVILLPARMSGRERHQRMAVMEAAISSSLSHPNVVQTYTYTVEEVQGAKARAASRLQNESLNHSTNPNSVPGMQALSVGTQDDISGTAGGAPSNTCDLVGYEIRLVQEFCDQGSLRDKLNERVFFKPMPAALAGASASLTDTERPVSMPANSPIAGAGADAATPGRVGGARNILAAVMEQNGGRVPTRRSSISMTTERMDSVDGSGSAAPAKPVMMVDLAAVLDTAIDIARAVAHLHREGIVHADLKSRNVLLKGSTHDPRGFVAKVADFGLSMRLDHDETHVSNAFHGTLVYMAPETLLKGHVSRASDVYSFGILLYELYSGETAYKDVPKALLGHAITKDNLRPVFPPALGAPFEYQLLACRCWESNPEIRPEFEFIVDELKRMRGRLCGSGEGVSAYGNSNAGSARRTDAGTTLDGARGLAPDASVGSSNLVAGGFLRPSIKPRPAEQWGMPSIHDDELEHEDEQFVATTGAGLHSGSLDHTCRSEAELKELH
ncbi:hypothetical protein HYH02_002490 [Chlamydomonas schloesseri]|uniref:Protein kinase domain-containing protein n=1 Tax=Chlamydomonas schloesseri TaxID=2026947 RepID=A0A835WUX7_9CHLO|nr:hypothetical protein HYH02_002490 [Chlamydomonas schloesseri]|eukprot:KAG2453166.1 hypothetical protein HYH02_002490 [Chlamydomonas schloesseri]